MAKRQRDDVSDKAYLMDYLLTQGSGDMGTLVGNLISINAHKQMIHRVRITGETDSLLAHHLLDLLRTWVPTVVVGENAPSATGLHEETVALPPFDARPTDHPIILAFLIEQAVERLFQATGRRIDTVSGTFLLAMLAHPTLSGLDLRKRLIDESVTRCSGNHITIDETLQVSGGTFPDEVGPLDVEVAREHPGLGPKRAHIAYALLVDRNRLKTQMVQWLVGYDFVECYRQSFSRDPRIPISRLRDFMLNLCWHGGELGPTLEVGTEAWNRVGDCLLRRIRGETEPDIASALGFDGFAAYFAWTKEMRIESMIANERSVLAAWRSAHERLKVGQITTIGTLTLKDEGLGDNVFRREGDYWLTRFSGSAPFRIQDSVGCKYIHFLITSPWADPTTTGWFVLDLEDKFDEEARRTISDIYERLTVSEIAQIELSIGRLERPENLLDPKTRAQLRDRIASIEELLESDLESDRRLELRDELKVLRRYHNSCTNKFGRDRTDRTLVKRSSDRVQKAIRRVCDRIEKFSPALAVHLRDHLTLGQYLSYHPDSPIDWES